MSEFVEVEVEVSLYIASLPMDADGIDWNAAGATMITQLERKIETAAHLRAADNNTDYFNERASDQFGTPSPRFASVDERTGDLGGTVVTTMTVPVPVERITFDHEPGTDMIDAAICCAMNVAEDIIQEDLGKDFDQLGQGFNVRAKDVKEDQDALTALGLAAF